MSNRFKLAAEHNNRSMLEKLSVIVMRGNKGVKLKFKPDLNNAKGNQ